MIYDFVVFGASGMQGRIVCRDLLEKGYALFTGSLSGKGLDDLLRKYPDRLYFRDIDLSDQVATTQAIRQSKAKVVINCAEGDWNLAVYKAALMTGAHVLDLGSDIPMTKEQIGMHQHFKDKNLLAITGCGSTPGVNNIMLHWALKKDFDSIDSVEAGFAWDSNIKEFVVPFSIQSIIEEFTEPAPYIENGTWLERMPLESQITKKYSVIGKQTSFLVRHPETYTFYLYYRKDGLRNMKFYAGFPDHSRRVIEDFIKLGLGSREEKKIGKSRLKPVDYLTEVLRDIIKPEGYTEQENLWVEVSGIKNGKQKKVLMECLVPTLALWEDAGCNIDTGLPASIMAQMVKEGMIKERGSFEPGIVVPAEPFFKELRKRQMFVYENGALVN